MKLKKSRKLPPQGYKISKYAFNPSILEINALGPEVQAQYWWDSKFEVSLGKTRPCLKITKEQFLGRRDSIGKASWQSQAVFTNVTLAGEGLPISSCL